MYKIMSSFRQKGNMTKLYNLTVFYKYSNGAFFEKHYSVITFNILNSIRLNYITLYRKGIYETLSFEYEQIQ